MEEKKAPLELYAYYMRLAQIEVPVTLWIFSAFVAALAVGIILFAGQAFFRINDPLIAVLSFLIVVDVFLGYPYLKGRGKIDAIEGNLPDALKQMADTLKAGATYEYALREVAFSQYGPLSDEMKKALRKLEEGENFENSLLSISHDVESRLVRRVITIIIDSVRAGAGLADVLDEISNDVREMNRIAAERKTKTVLQSIFMVAAGIVVAPFIFGLVSVVIDFLISTAQSASAITGAQLEAVKNAKALIIFSIKAYLLVLVAAVSVMLAVMREGKVSKSLLYLPLLLLLSYIVFYLSQIVTGALIGVSL